MDSLIKGIEIFALVSGVIYIVLEVKQKNLMWYFGMVTGVACAFQFGWQKNWANMGLNIYYAVVAVWGLIQWKKDSRKLEESGSDEIHLRRPGTDTILLSLAFFIGGAALLAWILRLLGDSYVILDAVTSTLSAIATIWLAESYPKHWLIWIVTDLLTASLCIIQGLYWMSALYVAYSAASAVGYFLWKKKGVYIN